MSILNTFLSCEFLFLGSHSSLSLTWYSFRTRYISLFLRTYRNLTLLFFRTGLYKLQIKKKYMCVCVCVYIYIYIIAARGTVFNILWQNIMEKNMKTNVCNYITDSLCCTEEINTTLFINYACVLSHWVVSESLPTPWIIARQAPLSMGFPRQETEVGCHALLQGIFQTQGLNRRLLSLLHWQAGSLSLAPWYQAWEAQYQAWFNKI